MTKFKPVYTVYFNEEKIGNVLSKEQLEKELEQDLYDNNEKNIAFADLNVNIKYKRNFVNKNEQTDDEKILLAVEENSSITYFEYAICLNGIQKTCVKTMEEAKLIQEKILGELATSNVSISTIYTKELNIDNEKSQDLIANEIIENEKIKIANEEKIKQSTINGIYLAVNPVNGRITSRYGANESIRNHTHKGLDIAAKTGTIIKAVANGKVSYSGQMSGYGNIVIIDHGNEIQTYYGHCSKLYVKVGSQVKAGQTIAAVGSTGNSTGPHLHFEIRKAGQYVNPIKYLYK